MPMTDPEEIIRHYTELPDSNIADTVGNHEPNAVRVSIAQHYMIDFTFYFGQRLKAGEAPCQTSMAVYDSLEAAVGLAYLLTFALPMERSGRQKPPEWGFPGLHTIPFAMQSSIGHYAPAFATLRNALELGLLAPYWDGKPDDYREWVGGDLGTPFTGALFKGLKANVRLGVLNERTEIIETAYLLMGQLSDYAHSRPNIKQDNGSIKPGWSHEWWAGSNGPIYVAEAFERWFEDYCRVVGLIALIWGAAFPEILAMRPDCWESGSPRHDGRASIERIGEACGWLDRTREAFEIVVSGGLP